MIVHLCNWASQPNIQLWCTQEFTQPLWQMDLTKITPGIYPTDAGRFYTFDKTKVTCQACLDKKE